MLIKICGLTRREDILCVNELLPDYIGFVFWEKSRRFLTAQQAAELKAILNPAIRAVGVFVDEQPEKIAALVRDRIIDVVQLHGQESESYLAALRESVSCPIIRAVKIRTEEDVQAAQSSAADMLLLDGGMGEGKTFDWTLLEEVKRPYLLAGGLSPENIGYALSMLSPYGVDVSSGVETNGKKDPEKIREFIRICRAEKAVIQ